MIISVLTALPATSRAVEQSFTDGTLVYSSDKIASVHNQSYKYNKHQYIIPKESLSTLSGKNLLGLTWYYVTFDYYDLWFMECDDAEVRNVDIYLTETSQTTLTGLVDVTGSTCVFSGNWSLNSSDDTINADFSAPYTYGGNNLLVTIIDNTGSEGYSGGNVWGYARENSSAWISDSNKNPGPFSASTTGGSKESVIPVTTFRYTSTTTQYVSVSVTPYNLSSSAKGGTVSIDSATPTDAQSSKNVEKGSSVTVKATPYSDYEFVCWRKDSPTGTQFSSNATATFTANANQTLYAIFQKSTAPTIVKSGKCGENISYKQDSEGTLTLTGSGPMYEYAPGTCPFDTTVKKVIISDGITSITNNAFLALNLTELITPSSMTYIGTDAFSFSNLLSNIIINGTDCVLERDSFREMNGSDRTITLNGVKVVGDSAFYETDSKTLNLGNVERIENGAFALNETLGEVVIPESCKYMGMSVFGGCSALQKITILNAGCQIYDSDSVIPQSTVIYGYTNSTAEAYATKYGRSFVSIGKHTHSYTKKSVTLVAPKNN